MAVDWLLPLKACVVTIVAFRLSRSRTYTMYIPIMIILCTLLCGWTLTGWQSLWLPTGIQDTLRTTIIPAVVLQSVSLPLLGISQVILGLSEVILTAQSYWFSYWVHTNWLVPALRVQSIRALFRRMPDTCSTEHKGTFLDRWLPVQRVYI
jgi:hypothetical protein